MATLAQPQPQSSYQAELDSLAEDFFNVAENQLARMTPEARAAVIESIHATAETLRAEK